MSRYLDRRLGEGWEGRSRAGKYGASIVQKSCPSFLDVKPLLRCRDGGSSSGQCRLFQRNKARVAARSFVNASHLSRCRDEAFGYRRSQSCTEGTDTETPGRASRAICFGGVGVPEPARQREGEGELEEAAQRGVCGFSVAFFLLCCSFFPSRPLPHF